MKTDIQAELTQAPTITRKSMGERRKNHFSQNILLDLVEKPTRLLSGVVIENDELKRHFFCGSEWCFGV